MMASSIQQGSWKRESGIKDCRIAYGWLKVNYCINGAYQGHPLVDESRISGMDGR